MDDVRRGRNVVGHRPECALAVAIQNEPAKVEVCQRCLGFEESHAVRVKRKETIEECAKVVESMAYAEGHGRNGHHGVEVLAIFRDEAAERIRKLAPPTGSEEP